MLCIFEVSLSIISKNFYGKNYMQGNEQSRTKLASWDWDLTIMGTQPKTIIVASIVYGVDG
jgi:hypothetical protein